MSLQPSSFEVSGYDLDAVLTDLAKRGASVSRMARVTGSNSRWLLSLYWSQPIPIVNNPMPALPSAGQARTRPVQPSAVLTLETTADAMAGQPEGKAARRKRVRNLFFWSEWAGRESFRPSRSDDQNQETHTSHTL